MSLINTENNQGPTLQELQVQYRAAVSDKTTSGFSQLVDTWNQLYDSFWSNPSLTPDQCAEALGTDLRDFFTYAGIIQVAVNQIKPNTLTRGALRQPIFNEDGSGTLK